MLIGQQQDGFDIAISATKPITSIGGFAGTGKSFLLAELAKAMKADVLTPTHKAATVLRDRGVRNARTLHSVLYAMSEYAVYELPDGKKVEMSFSDEAPPGSRLVSSKMVASKRDEASGDAEIALVDEGSMLSPAHVQDLLDVYKRLVILGDPFQLPPVKAQDFFGQLKHDVFLTEVHRTAMENPITAYATKLRTDGVLSQPPACKEIVCLDARRAGLFKRLAETNTQNIVWTNRLRHSVNRNIRKELGFPEDQLVPGDKLMVLSNVRRSDEDGNPVLRFYNGQEVESDCTRGVVDIHSTKVVQLKGDDACTVWPFWTPGFWAKREHFEWLNSIKDIKPKGADMDYRYAMTAHKSQGSEWPLVGVWMQHNAMQRALGPRGALRWFYTAITRAREKLVLVETE